MTHNNRKVLKYGKTFVFVTRGRSMPFSDKEVNDYFNSLEDKAVEALDKKESKPEWKIPDSKQRHAMFIRDLRMGMEFCTTKYAVESSDIMREALRIAPFMNVK